MTNDEKKQTLAAIGGGGLWRLDQIFWVVKLMETFFKI